MRVSVQEVEVGPFLIDLTTGRLLREGVELTLRPQACRVFKTLIQNRGQFVDYEHMIADAWDGTVVSPHTVDVTVGEVKKVLQEFSSWITHRPKVGYRIEVPKSEELVRKGWHFWNQRTRQGFERALTSFEEAAREDGTDFRAYEGLAASYLMLGTYCMRPPRDLYAPFLDAHNRAAALSGLTPESRLQRAHSLHVFERKFREAESEFLQAEREKPRLTKIYQFLAMLYVSAGRFDDALDTLAKGYKVDPLWPILPAVEITVRFFARDFDAAIVCGRNSVVLHPNVHVGHCFYAQALEYSGRLEEALREYRMACVMSSGLAWVRALEAACLGKIGRRAEAHNILKDVINVRSKEYADAYYLAVAYLALDMPDEALAELDRAREENSITLCLIQVDPKMDPLRHDSRFGRLVADIFNQQDSFNLWDSSQKSTVRA